MDANLIVKVGADVQQAVNGLKQVEQQANSMGKAAAKVNFTPISQTLRDAGNFAISANTGFVAISNNLPYVIDEFVRLKSETGSTKNAFSLLVGTLAGPAGIVSLIGVAATVIPILAGKFLQAEEKAKKAAKSNDDFAESLKGINSSLASEAAKVTGLVAVLNNDAESRERKIRAIKELKSIQPDYFGQLDLENGKVTNLALSYKNYLGSLLKVGEAQAATKKLAAVFDELLTVNEKLSGSASFSGTLSESQKLAQRAAEKLKELGINVQQLNVAYSKLNPEQKKWLDLYQKYSSIKTFDLTGETKALEERKRVLENQVLVYSDLIGVQSEFVKIDGTDKVNKEVEAYGKLNGVLQQVAINQQKITDGEDAQNLLNQRFSLAGLGEKQISTKRGNFYKNPQLEGEYEQVNKLKEEYQALAQVIASGVSGAFTQFINDVRSGKDVFESFGNAVLDAFANIVSGLIAVIIEAQILAALMEAFPALAGALSALGAVSSAVGAVSQIPKNASGGIATSATLGIVGEAGPEAIVPLSQLGYLMQQVNPGISSFGGGGVSVNVQGALVARGTDMVAVFNRSQRSMNRVG